MSALFLTAQSQGGLAPETKKLLSNYSKRGNEPWHSRNRLCYVAHTQGVIKKQGQ